MARLYFFFLLTKCVLELISVSNFFTYRYCFWINFVSIEAEMVDNEFPHIQTIFVLLRANDSGLRGVLW